MINKEIEESLLVKGINNKYVAKHILSKDTSSIFINKRNKLIADEVVKYYYLNDIYLDNKTLKEKVTKTFNELNRRNSKIGKPTFTEDQMVNTLKYVDYLFTLKDNNNPEHLKMLEDYVKNQLVTNAILRESANNDDTLAKRVINSINAIDDISLVVNDDKVVNVTKDMEKRRELYKEGFSSERLHTGLKSIDEVVNFNKQEVVTFSASSGGFKTGTLANLAYNYTIQGYNVFYVSLEGRASDMLIRFDKLFLNVNNKGLFDSNGNINPEFLAKQSKAYKDYENKNLIYHYDAPNTLTLEDLEDLLITEERKNQIKFDVVIVDYADLLKHEEYSNESLSGEKLFQGLNKIANEHDVLLLTGSQLNRTNVEADVKTLANVQGSYRKVNVCAAWFTINSTKAEKEKGYIRFYKDKIRNRYGKNDSEDFIYLKVLPGTQKFEDETVDELEDHKATVKGADTKDYKDDIKKAKPKDGDLIDTMNTLNNVGDGLDNLRGALGGN